LKVLVSPFRNPFINLALEDHFLRGGADLPVLFLYVNRPCVVLGRFQNPWIECNLNYLVQNDIWLVRRQSGGGCVFHDEGNLNFSLITQDKMVDRNQLPKLIKDAFKSVDLNLEISPRNDLWLNGKKISGSAYKQTKDGSFHHCTFLVSSDLDKLEECLKHTIVPKNTQSIASVRSRVISLRDTLKDAEVEDVVEIITHHLGLSTMGIDGSFLSIPQVQENFQQLRGQEWLWSETPGFELEEGIRVRKGQLEGEYSGPFTRESASKILSPERLDKLFPDFSEQHRSSNLIL